MLVAVATPPTATVTRDFYDRSFSPWNARGSIDVAATRARAYRAARRAWARGVLPFTSATYRAHLHLRRRGRGARGCPLSDASLWRHRSAHRSVIRDRVLHRGARRRWHCGQSLRLADWWFRADHVGQPGVVRAVVAGVLVRGLPHCSGLDQLRRAREARPSRRAARAAPVAIFTTSTPGEPLAMFDRTLDACRRIRYPHTTYLLDDTRDPRFRELAARHGAVCLELLDVPGAKAGKINRALAATTEEFMLVLDPDHVPFPEFLDRVLGHFDDARVGFVQVSQAYYNQRRSFTAAGAAEQTYAFYGPGQMGLYGHGACVAIGANCTFRRSALDSIGGHGIGLAEDLVTAIRMHAAGWKSVYVPEVLSRGLVPEDLGSFYRQQLKWARGVYEVAFTELPGLFVEAAWRQRLSYLAIGTYYLFGVTTPLFLVDPVSLSLVRRTAGDGSADSRSSPPR